MIYLTVGVLLVAVFLAYKWYEAADKLKTASGKVASLEQQKVKLDGEIQTLKDANDKLTTLSNRQAGVLAKSMVRNPENGRLQKFSDAFPKGL